SCQWPAGDTASDGIRVAGKEGSQALGHRTRTLNLQEVRCLGNDDGAGVRASEPRTQRCPAPKRPHSASPPPPRTLSTGGVICRASAASKCQASNAANSVSNPVVAYATAWATA